MTMKKLKYSLYRKLPVSGKGFMAKSTRMSG